MYETFKFLQEISKSVGKLERGLPKNSEWLDEVCTDDCEWLYDGVSSNRKVIINNTTYHSYSYLTLQEIKDFRDPTPEELGVGYNLFLETLFVLKELGRPEDVRVVFWFDN